MFQNLVHSQQLNSEVKKIETQTMAWRFIEPERVVSTIFLLSRTVEVVSIYQRLHLEVLQLEDFVSTQNPKRKNLSCKKHNVVHIIAGNSFESLVIQLHPSCEKKNNRKVPWERWVSWASKKAFFSTN